MQSELTKVTGQLSKAELKVQELGYALSYAEEQHQSTLAEKHTLMEAGILSTVDLQFRAHRRHQLLRVLRQVWQTWSLRACIHSRNQHVAFVHGAGRMQRQRVADMHALFSSWRNFLRLLWRGVVIRSKWHDRNIRTALTGWTQRTLRIGVRATAIGQGVQKRKRAWLLLVVGTLHAAASDIKWRRAAALRLARKIRMHNFSQILVAWASAVFTGNGLRNVEQGNINRACVLARSLQRRARFFVWLAGRCIPTTHSCEFIVCISSECATNIRESSTHLEHGQHTTRASALICGFSPGV